MTNHAPDAGNAADLRAPLEALRAEVSRVFYGKREILDVMLVALLARGHVLLEGVPGIAKTTLVKAFATALGLSARRVQFTPDLLPADITGSYVLKPTDGSFFLRPGPLFANVVLADEINRAPAKTQSALLEAMQERQVTIEGDKFELPAPFMVLATQNPVDQAGTYPLPEAQIDRFLVRLLLGYPSAHDEVAMLKAHGLATPEIRPVLDAGQVSALQAATAAVHVEDDLFDYAVRLAVFTRNHPKVVLGTSPRATLALVQAGKAHALVAGRKYLTPDDLRAMAPWVLTHRLVLQEGADYDPNARSRIIDEALNRVTWTRRGDAAPAGAARPSA